MDGELDGEVVKAGSKAALTLKPSSNVTNGPGEKRAWRRSLQRADGSEQTLHAIAVNISCRLELESVVVKSKCLGGDRIARSAIVNKLALFLSFFFFQTQLQPARIAHLSVEA